MSVFCQMERELAHISAMVALLKKSPAASNNPVMDPAYWRARIRNATRQAALDHVLSERVTNLIAQLDGIPTTRTSGTHGHIPSSAMLGATGKLIA